MVTNTITYTGTAPSRIDWSTLLPTGWKYLGSGGSELERPLAIVMVGGLITSTLFTLLALPSFYAWVGKPKGDPEALS